VITGPPALDTQARAFLTSHPDEVLKLPLIELRPEFTVVPDLLEQVRIGVLPIKPYLVATLFPLLFRLDESRLSLNVEREVIELLFVKVNLNPVRRLA
jgi:hypothetical protein